LLLLLLLFLPVSSSVVMNTEEHDKHNYPSPDATSGQLETCELETLKYGCKKRKERRRHSLRRGL
jgi:hypothetical protein